MQIKARHGKNDSLTELDQKIWMRVKERTGLWSLDILSRFHYQDYNLMLERTNPKS